MRLRKKPHTKEKLQQFTDFVITDKSLIPSPISLVPPTYVELGTGKGDFITQIAERNPQINFIGLEVEATCVLAAARKVREKNLANVRLIVFDINNVSEIFGEHEVDRLYINFCDPWPKKRHHKRRMIQRPRTNLIASKISDGGYLYFVTDWKEYAEFALEELTLTKGLKNKYDSFAPAQDWRFQTKFERKGLAANRQIYELFFAKACK